MAEQNKLTAFEFEKGNIWLKHTFFEVIQNNLTDAYSWDYSELDFDAIRPDFLKVYSFITDRLWDENNEMDEILNKIASVKYSNMALGNLSGGEKIEFTSEQIARILINMCFNANIFWDNGSHTKQEKEYFERTIFGKVINDLDCYLISDAVNSKQQNSNPGTKAPRQPKQPGKTNSFKARGPLSDQARGLVSQPHQKNFDSSQIYKIVDSSKSGKEVRAIIRPLNPKGDAGANINKVFISNANNYGDCVCLFTDLNKAHEFMGKAQAAYNNTPAASTLTLKQAKKDPNGYFEMATEFGNCLVLADGLNEELEEEINEEVTMVNPCKKLTDEELKEVMLYNAN